MIKLCDSFKDAARRDAVPATIDKGSHMFGFFGEVMLSHTWTAGGLRHDGGVQVEGEGSCLQPHVQNGIASSSTCMTSTA
jgi:hypothetical protein